LKLQCKALNMVNRGGWRVSSGMLHSACGLVWQRCKSPLDCIKVRNSELAKWLPLSQGTLVTVVLFKIFHRRNAVCEFVCIVTFRFWILKFLNCVYGLNTFIYVICVLQQEPFFLVGGGLLWAIEHICELCPEFRYFWEVSLWHCIIVSVVPSILQALSPDVMGSSAPVRQCHISEDWIVSCIAVSTFTPNCVFFVM
jgi:hypothetical protein